jgi:hypothetical protein
MNIAGVIYYILAGFKFGLQIPEAGTDVPKHVGMVKDHNFRYDCKL